LQVILFGERREGKKSYGRERGNLITRFKEKSGNGQNLGERKLPNIYFL